jgi:hypothetical protein
MVLVALCKLQRHWQQQQLLLLRHGLQQLIQSNAAADHTASKQSRYMLAIGTRTSAETTG